VSDRGVSGPTVGAVRTAHDDLALLAAFEPVVRLTQGEFFHPVGVEAYVRSSALWEAQPDGSLSLVSEVGELDLAALAAHGRAHDGPGQSLSAIQVPHSRRSRLRNWFRTERPRFRAGHRLAEVGITGRAIDALSRFSLLLRGSVPGGSAVASLAVQQDVLEPDAPAYHARVVRDGGWIVLQYWFFYSFNNWRSGFSGVNEHEADWEQVTIYLDGESAPDADGLPVPRWVVFSAHDEVGDDLRRRWDDPDLGLVDGRHPVVYAGAGSHSGAYLAGDYLITVAPPRLGGVVPAVRRLAQVFTPWARAAQGEGLGIPYIDYARGDGAVCGPGGLPWTRVLIDDETPWVRDYRGLWGFDSGDRLGGERGPAGPRYERSGAVRTSWGDPVGWAGLGKVAPSPTASLARVGERIEEIDRRLHEIESDVVAGRAVLEARATSMVAGSPDLAVLEVEERRLTQERLEAVALRDERLRLERAQADGLPDVGPHAHLSHRRLPLSERQRGRSWLLSVWSVVSTPIVLVLLATLFLPAEFSRTNVAILGIVVVVAVEALARGYLLAFLLRLLVLLVVLNFIEVYWEFWQPITAAVLALVAVVVLVVNVRDAFRH
jgi:hypothetical protein